MERFLNFLNSQLTVKRLAMPLFLVPKPQLGNASAPEAPASGRLPPREAGELPRQVRSQAGAWERGDASCSQTPVWEQEELRMQFTDYS